MEFLHEKSFLKQHKNLETGSALNKSAPALTKTLLPLFYVKPKACFTYSLKTIVYTDQAMMQCLFCFFRNWRKSIDWTTHRCFYYFTFFLNGCITREIATLPTPSTLINNNYSHGYTRLFVTYSNSK